MPKLLDGIGPLTCAEGPFEEVLSLLQFTVWPVSAADSRRQRPWTVTQKRPCVTGQEHTPASPCLQDSFTVSSRNWFSSSSCCDCPSYKLFTP